MSEAVFVSIDNFFAVRAMLFLAESVAEREVAAGCEYIQR